MAHSSRKEDCLIGWDGAVTCFFSLCRGAFGEDLGDDYFGFKALGLDQEYNVEAFTVSTMLQGRRGSQELKVIL